MKKRISSCIIICAFGLWIPQLVEAQGTVTYLSNLGLTSTGDLAVGSDSWLATPFETGANAGGYVLNSVQLAMTDASGNPSGFTVMLYDRSGDLGDLLPGSSLGSLSGSASPATAGTYIFTAPANLMLLPNTPYFLVLTAGTTVANGAYGWSSTDTYQQIGDWQGSIAFSSSDGLEWNSLSGTYPQYALDATAVPEPNVMSLLGVGGLLFGLCRWKKSR